ncbi:type I restriction-modification system subunit M [Microbulbifer sp. YPW16]|uniref:type I restriction-modification system subunit M n=1 Tax=Microbulbifer sp. YPW16 TaxID=2904242 RepID=UPI001E32487F|nr:class I SAM-dependent DNA methyltransferase [Microbulbifer sp. YPW16]UHQ55322.1 type I restriction-modification system subunit M [Microbulbifer sp. YPW16]
MITGELKGKVDRLWLEFWQGGISNPLTVIEQITFLMFARMLDINESRDEKRASRSAKYTFKRRFTDEQQHLRWSNFCHEGDPDKLMALVRDGVFKHFREHTSDIRFGDYMKDARLAIEKPSLLTKAVEMVSALPLEAGDAKGDLYEYLLSKLNTAGINGQFRTPRHIIRLMVELTDPEASDVIADPSVGTAGFLVGALEYLLEKYTDEDAVVEEVQEDELGSFVQRTYTGNRLSAEDREHIETRMLHGFDFDSTMLRIAAMNLYMHGARDPDIHYQDSLAQSFADRYPQQEKDAFNLILANPPFTGQLDEDTINPAILRMVKTKKTELLFVAQILRMLKTGGRSATVVPQGVLFGSSKAHQKLRELLIEDNQLDGVINLPSGVFKPYAGVATAILLFTKGGETDHVWFYDVKDDGFSLDDKRAPLYKDDAGRPLKFAGDLPKVLEAYRQRDKSIANTEENDHTKTCFWVSREELAANKYDLSVSSYQKVVHKQEQYDPPSEIITRLLGLESEIAAELKALEKML